MSSPLEALHKPTMLMGAVYTNCIVRTLDPSVQKLKLCAEACYAAQADGTSASYEILQKCRRYSASLCKHGEPHMAHGHAVNKMNH